MKIPNSITLQDLSKAFSDWRQTKTTRSQPVPPDLRKLTAEALNYFLLKEVITSTGLIKSRVLSIRDEYSSDPKPNKRKVSKNRKSKTAPVVHLSEIKVSPRQITTEKTNHRPSALIASIDDRFGRNLKVFSSAENPSALIQSFLGAELGVVR